MIRTGPSRYFPPAASASREGLLLVGGSLSADWLIDAYMHGIFPWPSGNVLAWWSPDPRAILDPVELHVPRRLERTIRSGRFRVTTNQEFSQVIGGCATAQSRARHTWITRPLRLAYEHLHKLGHAHSVEVYREGQLVGGVYGVAIGGMFSAESMFHRETDASKVALVALVRQLCDQGFGLIDIQQLNAHTARFGAKTIRRSEYLARLQQALRLPVAFAGVDFLQP